MRSNYQRTFTFDLFSDEKGKLAAMGVNVVSFLTYLTRVLTRLKWLHLIYSNIIYGTIRPTSSISDNSAEIDRFRPLS